MEKRMNRSLATRFGILATDIGRLRWSKPSDEPHMTRIIRGEIDTGSPTQELDIRDLIEVRDGAASRVNATAPAAAAPMALGGDDLVLDSLAGAQMAPAAHGPKEITQELDVGNLVGIREDARPEAAAQAQAEEEPERDGPAPSVLTSLADLKRIAEERKAEKAEAEAEALKAAKDRRIIDAMAAELERTASAGKGDDGPSIFDAVDPEEYIEDAGWEMPEITDPLLPRDGTVVALFGKADAGGSSDVTPDCSVELLAREEGRIHLKVTHGVSGTYERIMVDSAGTKEAVLVTDNGYRITINGGRERILAEIRHLRPNTILPDFSGRRKAGPELENVYLNRKVDILTMDVGHGFRLGPVGSGFGKGGDSVSLELYRADDFNPDAYSKEMPYQRRFILKGRCSKSFVVAGTHVEMRLNAAGLFIIKSRVAKGEVNLPKPSSLTASARPQNGSNEFDKAFEKAFGSVPEPEAAPEPHGLEDVMGGPMHPMAPPADAKTDTDMTMFDELCRSVIANGITRDVQYFVEKLSDADAEVRIRTSKLFLEVAYRGDSIPQEAVQALISALRDTEPQVKENANDALFYACQEGVPIEENIRVGLKDPRRRDHSSVMLSLKEILACRPGNDPFGD
ncbi:MAG: hypothetical protein AB1295_01820 [Candidatus Micrarchaeota archaeon]